MSDRFLPRWLGRCLDRWCDSACLACARERAHGPLLLCRSCASMLRSPSRPGCTTCMRPLLAAAADHRCGECRAQARALDQLHVRFVYQPPCTAVVHAFKFRGLTFLAEPLAAACCELFRPELLAAHVVVPVPLHRIRRWRRGHDQALGLARSLARRLHRPLCTPLYRHGHAAPQSTLDRARRLSNLAGALVPRRRARVAGHVLLVDDVTTTGTTLEAAARALKAIGAARVTAMVVARTPAPNEHRGGEWTQNGRDRDGTAVPRRGAGYA